MADDDDDLYETVSAMAERIGLEGKDKQRYIHEHMTRGGYEAVPQYVRRQDDDDDDRDSGGGFFGKPRRSSSERPRRDRRGGDSDDWYNG